MQARHHAFSKEGIRYEDSRLLRLEKLSQVHSYSLSPSIAASFLRALNRRILTLVSVRPIERAISSTDSSSTSFSNSGIRNFGSKRWTASLALPNESGSRGATDGSLATSGP